MKFDIFGRRICDTSCPAYSVLIGCNAFFGYDGRWNIYSMTYEQLCKIPKEYKLVKYD